MRRGLLLFVGLENGPTCLFNLIFQNWYEVIHTLYHVESCERIGFAEFAGSFDFVELRNSFPRSLLRGLEKVEIEAGLLALAHNLAKLAN